jgi:ankyrin repeat protein
MSGNEAKTIKVTPSWEGLGRVPKWVEDTRPAPFTELTDLEFASVHGRIEIIKILLETGADINARNPLWTSTPLMAAASGGHAKAVQFLIDYGADLEAKDSLGRTCLFTAVEFRYREIVQVLLDAGANANVSDDWGVTPIMCAVSLNNIKIAKILLAAGADVTAIERNGNTVSDFVSYKRYSIPIFGDFYTSERNKEMGRLLEEAKLKNGM